MRKTILAVIFFMTKLSFANQQLFFNAHIFDGEKFLIDDAFIVEDGKFLAVGNKNDLEKRLKTKAQKSDLNGHMVMPGFIEAHAHLLGLGQSLAVLNLKNMSIAEIKAAVKQQSLRQKDPNSLIEGRGWDQNLWPKKSFPSASMFDELNVEQPIILRRTDGHALWLNHRALKLASINEKTTNPEGGKIIRDEKGRPTGVLIDNAMSLAFGLKKTSEANLKQALSLGQKEALSFGITSFHDAGCNEACLELFKAEALAQNLKLRIYAMIDGSDDALVKNYLAQGPKSYGDFLDIRSIKYFADGALGSRGALLLQDYSDDKGNKGLSLMSENELAKKTESALKNGFQVATHAIGDQANRIVLNAYEKALKKSKNSKNARLRIEHAQLLDPDDHKRFAFLGIIASMQPIHCTSDMAWVKDRIGAERLAKRAYPWRSLLKENVRLAFGSDAPVEPINPLLGIYAAISRKKPYEGEAFRPEEKLNLKEALKAFYEDAAFSEFKENKKGKIAEGYLADFIVYKNKNIFHQSPENFLQTKPSKTFVGGQLAYSE